MVRGGKTKLPKEINMRDAHSYCDNLASELNGWKEKVFGVVTRIDSLSSGEKEKMSDFVRDLHMFVGELDNRIEGLRAECPTDWEPSQIEMEAKLSEKYIY